MQDTDAGAGAGAGEKDRAPDQPAAPRVVWNDAQMQASFANVINVVNTREEFILLFGTNRSWNPVGSQEWTVDLANRITLTPHAAKRLLLLMMQRMQDYEQRFGPISLE